MAKKIVLCDTNILIDVARGNKQAVDFVQGLKGLIAVSSITAMELFQGCRNNTDIVNVKSQLRAYTQLHADKQTMQLAYELSMAYYQKKLMVADAIIAATAIQNGLELVTNNVKDFYFIKGLKLYKNT